MKAKVSVKIATKEEAMLFAANPANRSIVALIVLLVVSFIFYLLAAFFAYLDSSSPKSVEEAIVGGVTDSNVAN